MEDIAIYLNSQADQPGAGSAGDAARGKNKSAVCHACHGATEIEAGDGVAALKATLERLGHEVKVMTRESGLHGIRVTPAGLDGGADKRREGMVLAN